MKLIILDRDGVINYDFEAFIKSPEEWIPLPGSLEAIARLCQNGYCVTVATNQSGIARGLYDMATLDAIHDKMRQAVAAVGGKIDSIFICPHGPNDGCSCRKPLPGMFNQIAVHYQQSVVGVPAVGDALRDLQAAQAAGSQPILVLTGKGKETLQNNIGLEGVPVYADLAAVVSELVDKK